MDTATKVKAIVCRQLDVKPDLVTEQSRFIEDLGADSLAVVEMVLEFEGEFELDIPDEVTSGMVTVGDVIAYVEKHGQRAA